MAKTNKDQIVVPNPDTKVKKTLSNEDEINLILFKTDERSNRKGTDEVLDEVNERAKLVNNTKFPDLIGKLQDYNPRFPLEFYRQIFRLYGWRVDSDQCLRKRPGVVAKITAYLIYLRFPVGLLRELQILNKKEDGERLFKHHQWLTPEGMTLLKQYIREANELMAQHSNWNQFIKDFTLKYSNPYNLKWENY
jgi:hypothetical protein